MFLAGLEATTGTAIYVSTADLTSYTATDYAGIAWTKVVGVVSFPEWGDDHESITEALIGDSRETTVAGVASGGTGAVNIQYRTTDAGREMIEAEVGKNTDVHVLKVYASGDGEAATVRFMSNRKRPVDRGAVRGQTMNMAVNTAVVSLTDTQVTSALAVA